MKEYTETGIWVTDEKSSHAYDEAMNKALIKVLRADAQKLVVHHPTVIDFGCGTGAYSKKLAEASFGVTAIDGNPKSDLIADFPIRIEDLSVPFHHEPVNYGICLEVGNHIPPHLCDAFLDNVCSKIEDAIVMSWAKPGQDGCNQLNRLDYDSLAAIMYRRGFLPDHEMTYKLRRSAYFFWLKDTTTAYRRFSA